MPPNRSLFRRVIIPVANTEDAIATTNALRPYIDTVSDGIFAVHVIEKAGGAPDKASVEQREQNAREIFEHVEDGLADLDVETKILYGTDIASTIVEAAHNEDASAIVFTPRGGSRWMKLLTGDVTTTLLNESDLPVLVLPDESDEAKP